MARLARYLTRFSVVLLALFALTAPVKAGLTASLGLQNDVCLTVETEDQTVQNLICLPLRVDNGALTDNGSYFSLSVTGTWDAVGDAAANGTIALAGYTTVWTTTLDGGSVWTVTSTDTDVTTDTVMLDLGSYDTGDANGIFLRARSDVDGTPVNVFQVDQTQVTATVPIISTATSGTVGSVQISEDPDNGTNYIELTVDSVIAANKTFTLPDAYGTAGDCLKDTDGAGDLGFAACVSLADDVDFAMGTGTDAAIQWDAGTTNSSLQIGTKVGAAATSGYISIIEYADLDDADREPVAGWANGATPADPTLYIASADATVAGEGLYLWHDQTDANIESVSGDIKMVPAGGEVQVTGGVTATGLVQADTMTVDTSIALPADAINAATEISADLITRTQMHDDTQKGMWNGVLEAPGTGDDDKLQWKAHTALTITEVVCSTDANTTTIQLDNNLEATPNTDGNQVMTSTLACDSDSESTAAFDDATIPVDTLVSLDVIATGAVDIARVHVYWTEDD
jgi:hypothetical protein